MSFLPLAGCAVMMAVCMGLMGGARRHRSGANPTVQAPSAEEVAALVRRWRAFGPSGRRISGVAMGDLASGPRGAARTNDGDRT